MISPRRPTSENALSQTRRRAAFDKLLATDAKFAREFLQRAGILTKSGKLAKPYR